MTAGPIKKWVLICYMLHISVPGLHSESETRLRSSPRICKNPACQLQWHATQHLLHMRERYTYTLTQLTPMFDTFHQS